MPTAARRNLAHMTRTTSFCMTLLATLALAMQAAAALPSRGCGKSLSSGNYTLSHAGVTRHYRLFVPTGYRANTASPLVVAFHGWGGNENEFLGNASVRAASNRHGYIVVAPRGLGAGAPDRSYNSWTFSGSSTGLDGDGLNPAVSGDTDAICDARSTPDYRYPSCKNPARPVASNTCSWTQCRADDVAFTRALLARIGRSLCVDTSRVFATGGSNGGMFVWELGQNTRSSSLFRAIAPVIGLPHRGYLAPPGRSQPLPVLLITGTQDTTVPPGPWENPGFTTTSNGSDRFFYTGATAITRVWSKANGCGLGTAAPFDDGVAATDCRTYCAGFSSWPRVLDCRASMGHDYGLPWSWNLVLEFFNRS